VKVTVLVEPSENEVREDCVVVAHAVERVADVSPDAIVAVVVNFVPVNTPDQVIEVEPFVRLIFRTSPSEKVPTVVQELYGHATESVADTSFIAGAAVRYWVVEPIVEIEYEPSFPKYFCRRYRCSIFANNPYSVLFAEEVFCVSVWKSVEPAVNEIIF